MTDSALRQAARELLEAYDKHAIWHERGCAYMDDPAEALRAALAEQEPNSSADAAAEPTRCVVTGNPCGTDTVPRGKQCPSESGLCVHKPAEPTQEQVLVPREPTEAMIDAAFDATVWPDMTTQVSSGVIKALRSNMRREWLAMIDAAGRASKERP